MNTVMSLLLIASFETGTNGGRLKSFRTGVFGMWFKWDLGKAKPQEMQRRIINVTKEQSNSTAHPQI